MFYTEVVRYFLKFLTYFFSSVNRSQLKRTVCRLGLLFPISMKWAITPKKPRQSKYQQSQTHCLSFLVWIWSWTLCLLLAHSDVCASTYWAVSLLHWHEILEARLVNQRQRQIAWNDEILYYGFSNGLLLGMALAVYLHTFCMSQERIKAALSLCTGQFVCFFSVCLFFALLNSENL